MYKRTSRTRGGVRTTTTKTIKKNGSTQYTNSRSVGSTKNGGSRYTSSSNLNSGKATKQYVTRNVAGYRKTTLLNPVGKKPKKPVKIKSGRRTKKSQPLGLFGWSMIIVVLILLSFS